MKPNSTAGVESVKLKAIKSDAELNEQQLEERKNNLRKQRAEACWKEIEPILKNHNCKLIPNLDIVIQGQRIGVSIVAV